MASRCLIYTFPAFLFPFLFNVASLVTLNHLPKLVLSLSPINTFSIFSIFLHFRIFPFVWRWHSQFSQYNSYISNTDFFSHYQWDTGCICQCGIRLPAISFHLYNLPALKRVTISPCFSLLKKCLKSTIWQGYDMPLIPAMISSPPLRVKMDAFHFYVDSSYITILGWYAQLSMILWKNSVGPKGCSQSKPNKIPSFGTLLCSFPKTNISHLSSAT